MRIPAPGTGGRPRAFPRLALGALLCMALGAWLAVPRERPAAAPAGPPIHLVLVDASASATRGRSPWPRRVRERLLVECDRAARRGADFCVLRFAGDVRVDFEPGPPAAFRAWLAGTDRAPYSPVLGSDADQGSELERALGVAGEILAEVGRPPGELLLLTDGTYTGADPRARLEALMSAGVTVSRERFEPPNRGDAALLDLRIGPRLEAGAPLVAEVGVSWRRGTPASAGVTPVLTLEFESDGGETRTARKESRPPSAPVDDAERFTWREWLELPAPAAGGGTLRARVQLERDGRVLADAMPENDVRSKEIRVGDSLTCLVLATPDRIPLLHAMLRGAAFAGIRLRPTTFADLAADLESADMLITESVGPAELPRSTIESFVQRGGGWLSMGGYGALRGWDSPDADALAAWLPLEPDESDPSERDVLLLIDGSGSMVGEPFETVRRAVVDLVLGARVKDRVQLRFFTGAMGDVVFEASNARREDLQRDLLPLFTAKVPRGPTDVLYALDQVAATREASAARGLVLLVTDGRTLLWHPQRSVEVRERLAASSTDLGIVAVGGAADVEFLGSLLLEGEALEQVTDLQRLRNVFEQRVQEERLLERTGQRARGVEPETLAPGGVGGDVLRAQLAGLGVRPAGEGERDLGAVLRTTRVRERSGAEVLWRTDDGTPVLALWRRGAGLVASLGTTPLAGWAPGLAERPELLAPLLRALGRGRDASSEPGLRLTEEAGQLLLEFVPSGAPVVVTAEFHERSLATSTAEALGSSDPDRAFGVRERALGRIQLMPPAKDLGADPRSLRSAPRPPFLDRARPGGALAVDLSGDGKLLGRVHLLLAPPLEFSHADERLLVMPTPAHAPDGPHPGEPHRPRAPHPATPWVLALGLLLGTLAATRLR